uniref:Hepcidin n=1 Tax=Sander lucioperca TaxID=283035 RepID=A0A8C9XAW1_SANLU
MKTFSVAVAVAVVLTFICIQQSSAVPVTEVQELEEPMTTENPIAEYEATSMESWKHSCIKRHLLLPCPVLRQHTHTHTHTHSFHSLISFKCFVKMLKCGSYCKCAQLLNRCKSWRSQ